ncbi:EamA family transporter RarD [Mesobacillus zeae]|uniref:EamA family transporter RarD n=1 Tax=Mesobacillus zeae TaxID=1917180 RepID=A0A398B094_9BACI|nr:EamA family transporter RarD [Mesobacillus zeae]RID83131.1 EamA family transporter RarD [Mesobacillus zeae]
MSDRTEQQKGVLYAAFSYFLWGILPIYWKFLGDVNAEEILANRVFWSFFFMLVFLAITNRWQPFTATIKGFTNNKRQLMVLAAASVLISINWFIYIWSVNTGQMIEASLGYYINPLVSVLLGIFFFKERLSRAQILSFFLAAAGVVIMTVSYGKFPWISITLALSFGLYGLAKKLIKVDSSVGLALETMVMTPLAAIYMGSLFINHKASLFAGPVSESLLLIGAGAVTAIPLLYFAKGAQKIPLSMLGFLQYIAPSLTLLLGVFIYGEEFTKTHFIAFSFIWTALALYTFSRTRKAADWESKIRRRKSA